MPGSPQRSRMRAASMTSGSQFARTRSTERPRSHSEARSSTSVLVHEPRHLQIVAQVGAHLRRQRLAGRVADAVDLGADLGEAAGVLQHLGG